ncbi:radical SAM protein [Bacteroides acidifaciens]|jgi:DNA repair photolyase|uniref:radical SAM protein n=1 Tax=Bacteroides acidifaciens TaxID=85831 RepID=UPI002570B026|nr:radical SAM protein [Bacteroides acidifaciens]
MEKRYNGKAIYQPKGKAAEYSPWACNFFTGCSNDCSYCYCKRGVLNHYWSTNPKLKKRFKDEGHAIEVFNKELDFVISNYPKIKDQGLLFSFTTDPLLSETRSLTLRCTQVANEKGIPVKILTKRADFVDVVKFLWLDTKLTAFGFTLTGFDEEEPWASPTDERIEAMRELHEMGFRTFASIEPILTPAMSRNMIEATRGYCDFYKIGLISGKGKDFYNETHLKSFYAWLSLKASDLKIYLKDSIINHLGIKREELPGHFVNSNYNIFNYE